MPKIAIPDWKEEGALEHPILGTGLGPFAYKGLGDAAGLTQFGFHLERLPPGSRSSFRHWHEAEDEIVYMLEGEVVLIEDDGETPLRPGDAAGWKAGAPNGHCLVNRSTADAVYVLAGIRSLRDTVHYPDHDLTVAKEGPHRRYMRADGTVIQET